jgi:beta-phosphoglucomutase-like phosphatase (HAD superfamily)/phosphatidylglycerophosphate synthase
VTPFLLRAFPCITPIQVSVLGLLAGVLASILFSVGWPVVAGVAAMLASVLDGSDGEIARLKKAASSLGRYFDAVLDRYADALILVGAGAYAWSHPITEATSLATWHVIVVIVAALALVGHLMVSYTSARALVDLGHAYRGRLIQAGRGRDLRLFVVSIGGILTLINPVSVLIALVVVAGLANATVVGRLWVSWRRVRRAAPDVTAVIFDLDGTLADTMPFLTTIAIEALKRRGLPPERARQRYLASVGLDFAGQLEEIFPLDPANEGTAADFEAEKRAGIASSGLIPGALELLAFLSGRGIRCFTVSSTSHEVVAGYLAHTGLDANLDDWTAFGPGFDKHAQVASLLRTHDLDPRRVLFVADAPRDFELVRSSLVGFVGVRSTFGAKPFRDLGLDSVADLKQLRSRWARSEPLEATSTPGAGRSAAAP